MMRSVELTVMLCCAWLSFAADAQAQAGTPRSARQQVALGGDFVLKDTDGNTFRLDSQRGKLVLIYFGYTGCPDVCPTDMLQLRDLVSLLGERAERVLPVFISLDPARDTAQHLADYAAAFSPAIVPLTGSEAQLHRIAKANGAHFRYIGRTHGSTDYTVDHPANLYVVDPAGKLARIVPYGTPTAEVAKAIAPLLE